MKIIILNKKEQKELCGLLMPLVTTHKGSYELTRILEKVNYKAYQLAFSHPEIFERTEN